MLRVLILLLLLLLLLFRHVFTSSHPHFLLVVGVECCMYACMNVEEETKNLDSFFLEKNVKKS